MRLILYGVISSLLVLSGCFFQEELPKQSYFIQLWWESESVTKIRPLIVPLVDAIINQELQRENGPSLFLAKEKNHQPVSLYSIKNMHEDGEKYLLEALDKYQENQKIVPPRHVVLTSKVEFFGEWHDELVILVNDQARELSLLNKVMKKMVHQVDDMYKQGRHRDLYDIKTSERFPFVPHIGLGRIRSNSIKQLVQNPSEKSVVLERIKQRIKQEVLPIIEKKALPPGALNKPLLFTKLSIFALPKRTRIKEYRLELNGL